MKALKVFFYLGVIISIISNSYFIWMVVDYCLNINYYQGGLYDLAIFTVGIALLFPLLISIILGITHITQSKGKAKLFQISLLIGPYLISFLVFLGFLVFVNTN